MNISMNDNCSLNCFLDCYAAFEYDYATFEPELCNVCSHLFLTELEVFEADWDVFYPEVPKGLLRGHPALWAHFQAFPP